MEPLTARFDEKRPVADSFTAARGEARSHCFHCGNACLGASLFAGGKAFCCEGCRFVFELLAANGLTEFYQLNAAAGVRVGAPAGNDRFRFLDEPAVRERLVDFADARRTRVTLRCPAIHCLACVWLLENLFHLKPGIGQSQVNFARREVSVVFDPAKLKLSDIAALLASLGYEPELKFADLENHPQSRVPRRLWMQLGLAGFAFGNAMLFSIATYLGLDGFSGPAFTKLVGFISLALAVPVVTYSAADYYRSAWVSLRQQLLNIDVPIAAGIIAIFVQSAFEVVSGRGEGYFDSLCGLIFFLLCGKLFQQKTYDRLAFDRDYKSFFPLSVTRKQGRGEESISLAQLAVGDHLLLRNGELIPADAKLIAGPAVIDYSFVTGESEPVEKKVDDHLYAGGRQIGGAIEVEMVKGVSQSYLTSLWNQDAFRKDKTASLNALTNTYSQRFTKIVIAIALGAALFWAFVDPAKSLKSFTSVLIVACPCALALAAPFALGTAQRVLGRRNVFLKNPYVLESLAKVDAVVFDKTGTLTAAGAGSVTWMSEPLSEAEECWLYSMTRHSTHPLPVRIGDAIARNHFPEPVRSFLETAGCGMEGAVAGNEIWMGSAAWLESRGAACSAGFQPAVSRVSNPPGVQTSADDLSSPPPADWKSAKQQTGSLRYEAGSHVHVAINGKYRGAYVLESALRPDADGLITKLTENYELALLSGDHEKERARFAGLFGETAHLRFNQSPLNKLGFIRDLQRDGKTVMMVGDGLNDAGALKQSDVGVAVVENVNAFSPASDVILAAVMVPRIGDVLRYAKQSVRMVRAAFVISSLYNVVGVAIAAGGNLSPIVCAILMPLSSVTVVAFACGATTWLGRGLADGARSSSSARSAVERAELELRAPKAAEVQP